MENYLSRQYKELRMETNHTKSQSNSIYELMQERPRHTVRAKESEFRASDVPLIQAGQLKKIRRF